MTTLTIRRCSSTVAKVVFSGIQPTGGVPHLGNYLGALRPWVEMQNSGTYSQVVFSIVDLHAMTASRKAESLKRNSLEIACSLLACGIDPAVSCVYRQSHVPQHTMLYWLFACHSSLARLYHMTQWKQKSGASGAAKDDSNMPAVDVGMYTYPLLQAADILLFKATHVPIGEDQLQHLRLTQEIARKFNNTVFPQSKAPRFFPVPEPLLSQDAICGRVHSLRDPNSKMSKSDPDKRSRIELDDDADSIRSKFRKAVTDTHSSVTFDPTGRPGVSNLIAIHAALSGRSVDSIVSEVSQMDTGAYKMVVADCVIETLRPIRNRLIELRTDLGAIERILDDGAQRARKIADQTWQDIAKLLAMA